MVSDEVDSDKGDHVVIGGPKHLDDKVRPSLLGDDLEHGDEGLGECVEVVEVGDSIEKLEGDGRGYYDEGYGEYDQAA